MSKKRQPKYDDWCGQCQISPKEHAEMRATIATLRKQLAEAERSRDKQTDLLLAIGFDGVSTTVIGKKAWEEMIATARAEGWAVGREAAAELVVQTRQVRSSDDRASIVFQIRELQDPLAQSPKPDKCKTCGGSGWVPHVTQDDVPCPACQKKGGA